MGLQIEAIERAINFNPRKGLSLEPVDLGPVDEKRSLVNGLFSYQERAVFLPGEPLVDGQRTQLIWALVQEKSGRARGRAVTALAYVTDVLELRGDLASRVIDKINAIRDRQEASKY